MSDPIEDIIADIADIYFATLSIFSIFAPAIVACAIYVWAEISGTGISGSSDGLTILSATSSSASLGVSS